LQTKPLLISTPFESRLAILHMILKSTAVLFSKESFLHELLRYVIHDDLAFSTVDSARFRDMTLEVNDSLADFGCLQTDETIKRSIMDNYKAYKGDWEIESRGTIGKIHISFGFSKNSTKTSNTSERCIVCLPRQARVNLGSLRWLRERWLEDAEKNTRNGRI